MELFSKKTTRDFFLERISSLEKEIEKISDKEITECNADEWLNYYVSKYEVRPIVLEKNAIEQHINETKVKQYNPFAGSWGEPDYYEADGIKISYKIPIECEPELMFLQPSTHRLCKCVCDEYRKPTKEEYGYFVISLKFRKNELENKKEKMQEFVKGVFGNSFEDFECQIGYINDDVNNFNTALPNRVKDSLEKRRSRADSLAFISKQLEIPLQLKNNSPNTKPILLKKINKAIPQRPQARTIEQTVLISSQDYENINNIIYMMGSSMEKTARSYIGNNEEELRDHIIAALETHYDNVTGETFRKIGKTDIQIVFENKAAFIGECKVWHGKKKFEDAIQQVLNYSTWRDGKLAVIVFNKENSNFKTICQSITEWAEACTKSYSRPQLNQWICHYYRQDMENIVDITVHAFDLYVDKRQIKDSRYK